MVHWKLQYWKYQNKTKENCLGQMFMAFEYIVEMCFRVSNNYFWYLYLTLPAIDINFTHFIQCIFIGKKLFFFRSFALFHLICKSVLFVIQVIRLITSLIKYISLGSHSDGKKAGNTERKSCTALLAWRGITTVVVFYPPFYR